jgi:hypothetical protein
MNNFFPPFNMRPPRFNNKYNNSNFYATPIQHKTTSIPKNAIASTKKNIDEVKNTNIKKDNSISKPILDFFGIRLYSDDILILLLIYFLYKENVNDTLLIIALFSLLF